MIHYNELISGAFVPNDGVAYMPFVPNDGVAYMPFVPNDGVAYMPFVPNDGAAYMPLFLSPCQFFKHFVNSVGLLLIGSLVDEVVVIGNNVAIGNTVSSADYVACRR